MPRADCDGRSLFEELVWQVRLAFFRDAVDVAALQTLLGIAARLELPVAQIEAQMANGEAMALLCRDVELRDEFRVEGSPTYVLNDGRQKLYGNVGYKVIAANVEEILNRPEQQASWC
jgi:predicted DsbA family dithiol-disulfide isomerase